MAEINWILAKRTPSTMQPYQRIGPRLLSVSSGRKKTKMLRSYFADAIRAANKAQMEDFLNEFRLSPKGYKFTLKDIENVAKVKR